MLEEFTNAKMNVNRVKQVCLYSFKSQVFLDNYIVHHALEEDTDNRNPWKLQLWIREEKKAIQEI